MRLLPVLPFDPSVSFHKMSYSLETGNKQFAFLRSNFGHTERVALSNANMHFRFAAMHFFSVNSFGIMWFIAWYISVQRSLLWKETPCQGVSLERSLLAKESPWKGVSLQRSLLAKESPCVAKESPCKGVSLGSILLHLYIFLQKMMRKCWSRIVSRQMTASFCCPCDTTSVRILSAEADFH